MAGNVVRPDVEAALYLIAEACIGRAFIHFGADAGDIGDKLRRAVGDAFRVRYTQRFGNILDGIEHARTIDRLAQIDHAPAVERVDAGIAHVGGGSFQYLRHLRAGHIRKALHQHRDAARHVRRRH